jgi:hypothetical protein
MKNFSKEEKKGNYHGIDRCQQPVFVNDLS